MREAASFIARQTQPAGNLFAGALHFAHAAVRFWNRRNDLARLREFDDYQLADIGITREDLSWAVNLPFSQDPTRALEERALRRHRRGWRGWRG